MADGKIDKVKLSQMLRSGKSGKDCAKLFGVTQGAISQAKKELNISVVKSVALESAHRVVDKSLNAVDQLRKINEKANTLLDEAIKAKDNGTAIRAMGEIRQQLGLQLEIVATLYDLKAVQEFQEEVLSILGEVDEKTRSEIIRRLRERRALRSVPVIT